MPYYCNTLFQKIQDEVFFSMPFYGSKSVKNKTVTSEWLLSYLFFLIKVLIDLTNGRKEPKKQRHQIRCFLLYMKTFVPVSILY